MSMRASVAQYSGLSHLANLANNSSWLGSARTTAASNAAHSLPDSASRSIEDADAECVRIVNREIQKYEDDGLVPVTDGIDLVRFWDVRTSLFSLHL